MAAGPEDAEQRSGLPDARQSGRRRSAPGDAVTSGSWRWRLRAGRARGNSARAPAVPAEAVKPAKEPMDPDPTPEEMAMQRAEMQMEAIETASGAVDTALAALGGSMPTQSQIDAVNSAITRLNSALSAAADVSDDVKSGYAAQVSTATAAVMNAESALSDANERMRMEEQERMAMQAAEEREMARKIFNAIVRDRRFDNTGGKATHLRLTRNVKGPASGLIVSPLDLALVEGIDPDASNETSTTSTENRAGVSNSSNVYLPTGGIPVTEMLPDRPVSTGMGRRVLCPLPNTPRWRVRPVAFWTSGCCAPRCKPR